MVRYVLLSKITLKLKLDPYYIMIIDMYLIKDE